MTDQFNPSPRLGDRLESLEKKLRGFGRMTRTELIYAAQNLGLKERVSMLSKSIGSNVRKRSGDIDGVSFSFARHGIFLEHGVGKNRPKGSAAASRTRSKIGSPWLAPTLDDAVEKLADLLAEEYADIVAAEVVIRIPGIIDTSIR